MSCQIEQSAIPLAVWLDSPFASSFVSSATSSSSPASSLARPFIVVSNSDYKFKLFRYEAVMPTAASLAESALVTSNPADSVTVVLPSVGSNTSSGLIEPSLQCVRTCLAPTFGGPVQRGLAVPMEAGLAILGAYGVDTKDGGGRSERRPTSFMAYSTGNKVDCCLDCC